MRNLKTNSISRNPYVLGVLSVILLFIAMPVFSQGAPSMDDIEGELTSSFETVIFIGSWIMRVAAVLGLAFLVYTGLVDDDGARKLKPYIIRYVIVLIVWGIFEAVGITSNTVN